MHPYHLPHWLQATIAASGGLGLFVLGFLDSTFLPFPSVNDLLLVDLCIEFPRRMAYYASMSTIGSVVGCLLLFEIARRGEEAAFHEKAGAHGAKIRTWMQRNGFITMLVAALLPPPTPFKLFVLGAGVFGVPLRAFVLAIVIARTVRFFGEGYLAIHYGPQALHFLGTHRLSFVVGTIATIAACYFAVRLLFPSRPQQEA